MRKLSVLVMLLLCLGGSVSAFAASEDYPPVLIWKSQRMGYFAGHYFAVSIGGSDNPTPTGKYTVKKKVIDYWSKKYDRAMPYAVFFTDAHALHTGDLSTLSHGCIRVDRNYQPWIYEWAQPGKTKVIIYP